MVTPLKTDGQGPRSEDRRYIAFMPPERNHLRGQSHKGKCAFFSSEDGVTGKRLPKEMECYSCPEQHGAVDSTFVQFYPTLLEIAKKKNTLSAAYVKEEPGK